MLELQGCISYFTIYSCVFLFFFCVGVRFHLHRRLLKSIKPWLFNSCPNLISLVMLLGLIFCTHPVKLTYKLSAVSFLDLSIEFLLHLQFFIQWLHITRSIIHEDISQIMPFVTYKVETSDVIYISHSIAIKDITHQIYYYHFTVVKYIINR